MRGRPLCPAFIQYPVLVIKTERCTFDHTRPFSFAFARSLSLSLSPQPPSSSDPLRTARHRSLVTLIPSDLQPSPPPGSNKSAPLHVPAPNPLSIPPFPSLKSMHPRPVPVTRPPCPAASHPRTRACVSPRFALLDHVRMSSPTALTRFTLESLLCRGTRRRNTRARTTCPGTISAANSSRGFFRRLREYFSRK